MLIAPFWLSTDEICMQNWHGCLQTCQSKRNTYIISARIRNGHWSMQFKMMEMNASIIYSIRACELWIISRNSKVMNKVIHYADKRITDRIEEQWRGHTFMYWDRKPPRKSHVILTKLSGTWLCRDSQGNNVVITGSTSLLRSGRGNQLSSKRHVISMLTPQQPRTRPRNCHVDGWSSTYPVTRNNTSTTSHSIFAKFA